ncbi:MAG: urate hydroxylase PuuD [Candidatus Marinimicrobia bacterium]|nr:urate hydroxylase PuuD [Candidatus Neomarinimicrobiota bacterium]
MEDLQALFRWTHIIAGIIWIGLLYWFNFINLPFAATIDGETKQKIVPELFPRTLYWFRWGAAWTWVTGIFLLLIVFYHQQQMFDPNNPDSGWTTGAFAMLAVTFLGVFVYDALFNMVKNTQVAVTIGFILLVGIIYGFIHWGNFEYRAFVIHTGTLFGTIMAFNVWFRIWPAQQKIIPAIKEGKAPDADLVSLAGLRSKHNTYLSVPLIWTMINVHHAGTTPQNEWWYLPIIVLIGWGVVYLLYKKASKVKGF